MATISSITLLLLILALAGWFVFKSQVNNSGPLHEDLRKIKLPLHKESKVEGIVLEYGSNPEGDIDKMLVDSPAEKIWLHFPPHMARAIKEATPVNSPIEAMADIGGPARHDPNPVYRLKYLRNQSTKVDIDLDRIPAPAPSIGVEVEVKGNTAQDFKNGQGRGNTFILAGKLISLPPHKARELIPLISQAKIILVKGNMRDTAEGFLSASGRPVVKASSIQLDSITYKIR